MVTNPIDAAKRKTYVIFIILRTEHWKLFIIRSSRRQFYSQRWILPWSFVEQLYQLTFFRTPLGFSIKKFPFFLFQQKLFFFFAFSWSKAFFKPNPPKMIPKRNLQQKFKNLNFGLFWNNSWLKQDNWWPVFTPSFFSSKEAVHCCSVENVFWNFLENTLENTRDGILQLQ